MKPFLTYDQQLDILEREKGLLVGDHGYALSVLRDVGYFALVDGYKWPLRDPMTRRYVDGTRFEDVVALYRFDEGLRQLVFPELCRVERKLRNTVAHAFCERHGVGQAAYLDASNYSQDPRDARDVRRLLSTLDSIANRNRSHAYLVHQRERHGNVPLWAAANALTFGQISKMYALLLPSEKAAVAKQFPFVNERQLQTMLRLLVVYRNVCVHNERLFSYRASTDIHDTPLHAKLGIALRGETYALGKHDLFALLIALRYLLPRQDFLAFKRRLSRLIDRYVGGSEVIDRSRLLGLMGFPENWKNVTRYGL